MKKDLINSYESLFNQFFKKNKVPPLSLSESFTPATIYCSHQNKEDAEKFISSIFELSSGERFKSARCEEYVLVINKLLTLRCRWSDPLAQKGILSQVIEQITSTPIDVVHQAVITLPKLLGVVRGCSREGENFIKLDSTLKCWWFVMLVLEHYRYIWWLFKGDRCWLIMLILHITLSIYFFKSRWWSRMAEH